MYIGGREGGIWGLNIDQIIFRTSIGNYWTIESRLNCLFLIMSIFNICDHIRPLLNDVIISIFLDNFCCHIDYNQTSYQSYFVTKFFRQVIHYKRQYRLSIFICAFKINVSLNYVVFSDDKCCTIYNYYLHTWLR